MRVLCPSTVYTELVCREEMNAKDTFQMTWMSMGMKTKLKLTTTLPEDRPVIRSSTIPDFTMSKISGGRDFRIYDKEIQIVKRFRKYPQNQTEVVT